MPILEGSYIYLLIFQIIVIALLLLFLLWLVIRRLRGLNVDTLASTVSNNTIVQDEALIKLTDQQKEKIASLEQELSRLESAASNIKALQDENASLKEKIKTLEKKLLEYEILQEEIGTLSYLKIENEKLKKQIMEQQGGAALSVNAKNSIIEENANNNEAQEVRPLNEQEK